MFAFKFQVRKKSTLTSLGEYHGYCTFMQYVKSLASTPAVANILSCIDVYHLYSWCFDAYGITTNSI